MNQLKTELIKADIEEYKRRIDYCNKIINRTIKTKERWEKRLENKRRLLE